MYTFFQSSHSSVNSKAAVANEKTANRCMRFFMSRIYSLVRMGGEGAEFGAEKSVRVGYACALVITVSLTVEVVCMYDYASFKA